MKPRRRRLLYAAAFLVLAALVTAVGSVSFGDYGPANPEQTAVYWAVSTLVFLLTVTLGFMLFRTAARLYIDRRAGREGSRIRTKLLIGALALTFLPVFFLELWSVQVLNYNLGKWFGGPTEGVRNNLGRIISILEREGREKASRDAVWLAAQPESAAALKSPTPAFDALCRQHRIEAAAVVRPDGSPAGAFGPAFDRASGARAPILEGARIVGYVVTPVAPPAEIAGYRRNIENYIAEYDGFVLNRKSARNFYLLLLAAITLFILFVATWIALFVSKQISNPIIALLEGAGQVRQGNLGYRVQTKATDEIASLVRAFNEMTEELHANSQELERRRRFTEAILEGIPTGVISIASDGRLLRANRAFTKLFPRARVEAAERLEDVFTREQTAEIKLMMKRARRIGKASRQMELRGEDGALNLSVTIAALEEKLTSGFVVLFEDTTDMLRAQKAAAWHEVARRIAHEIKNPLTPIALCSDRIARQLDRLALPRESERILRECTATIGDEVESVKTLVDEFAQFARFPTAQLAPADLNETVEAALAVFAGRLEDIEIERRLAPSLPPVHIDRELFKRVVVNLVENAVEAMQEAPMKRLEVSTQAAGDMIELVVADSGCGISPEDRDRLFLPYFSTKGRGTGLGLAIASHILAEHGAAIRAEDNAPAGARFIIEIPAPAGEPERALEANA
jgi:two-component system nitrogen regulation sensor histidine kinase NtrY